MHVCITEYSSSNGTVNRPIILYKTLLSLTIYLKTYLVNFLVISFLTDLNY